MVAKSFMKTESLSSDRCKIWPSVRAICSNVICGFFFPQPCCFRGENVHRDARTKPMADQALISSHFKRAESTLLLGSLEPFFHMPASEGHAEHFFKRRVFRSVADEVFDFFRLGIPGHDQPVRPIGRTRSAIGILRHQVYSGGFYVPDARATGRLLDAQTIPFLLGEQRAKTANVVDLLRCVRPLKTATSRSLGPTTEVGTNLADQSLAAAVHAIDELGNRRKFFVTGDPAKADSIGSALVNLIGRHLPFGAKYGRFRNMSRLAAIRIINPALRKINIRGNAGAKRILGVIVGVNQMLADHAIVDLSRGHL